MAPSMPGLGLVEGEVAGDVGIDLGFVYTRWYLYESFDGTDLASTSPSASRISPRSAE